MILTEDHGDHESNFWEKISSVLYPLFVVSFPFRTSLVLSEDLVIYSFNIKTRVQMASVLYNNDGSVMWLFESE